MKIKKRVWFFQIICVVILFPYGIAKFLSNEVDYYIFGAIGLGNFGLYLIGTIEVIASLFMLTRFAAIGALLVFWVMLGALIAHLTVIGIVIDGSLKTFISLFIVLSCSLIILKYRKSEIPFIGKSLS